MHAPLPVSFAHLAIALAFLFATSVAQTAEREAQAVVRETTDRFLAEIQRQHAALRGKPERLYALVDEIVVPAINVEVVTRLALGKHWRRFDPGQQRRFQEAFRRLLLRTYGAPLLDALEDPSKLEIRYLPNAPNPTSDDTVVRTTVRYADRPPVQVDYRMRQFDGQWKAYDVIVAGISSVMTYRSTFGELIQTRGVEELIKDLEVRGTK
jgi:phospholipid transport system substrate-binding protein